MVATGVILLLLVWRGCVSQAPSSYTVNAPRRVQVQEGLCVFIKCTFTYPPLQTLSDMARGYWCRDLPDLGLEQFLRVAGVNDPSSVAVSKETADRFQIVGNIQKNDCSLRIHTAQRKDQGNYFFRIEDTFKYSYRKNMTLLTVEPLTEKPEIVLPTVLAEGTSAHITCTAPGRCSGLPPLITWKETLNTEHSQSTTSKKQADGTQVHTSTITFMTSRKHNKSWLICEVFYPMAGVSTQEVVLLNIQYSTKSTENNTEAPSPQGGCSSMSSTLIIGMAIGNLLVLSLVGILAFYCVKRIKNKYKSAEAQIKGAATEQTYEELGKTQSEIYLNLDMDQRMSIPGKLHAGP
ncbi:sialic acid-binding Ig-like lectin 13 isoform X2 [Pleurodeles waltl]|uniref:sialic acid-binding Ig-like lectin 13 isoform X2 n=1 Tax=Pleurodeles waltl TaxID=8319 RepID=UPI0037095CEE